LNAFLWRVQGRTVLLPPDAAFEETFTHLKEAQNVETQGKKGLFFTSKRERRGVKAAGVSTKTN
jgi:hypothetical protein